MIKFQIENISSQDQKQCFQTYPAEIVPPGIPHDPMNWYPMNTYILNDHNHQKTETSDTERNSISQFEYARYQIFLHILR